MLTTNTQISIKITLPRTRVSWKFQQVYLLTTIFLLVFGIGKVKAQGFYDSLEKARFYLNEGNFKEAFLFLDALEKANPGEENMIRLKGQALYWSKDFEQTNVFFRKKISEYPELQWIKLDYGRILYELNQFKESQEIVSLFLKDQPEHPEANQMMAAMNYWTGGDPKVSYRYLDKILTPYPENPAANDLKSSIRLATAPYIIGKSEFSTDTQPLQFFRFSTSGSFYQNTYLQPGYLLDARSYTIGSGIFWGQFWNKSTLPATGTSLMFRAGLANSSTWSASVVTYGIAVSQKLPGSMTLIASLDKGAYFYTLASLSEQVLPMSYRLEIGRDQAESWTGKAMVQRAEFEDSNWVQTISVWALYPVLKISTIRMDLGYAFNQSNSKEVRFEPNRPILNRQNSTPIGAIIPGAYTPYFTPINQQIHAALAKAQIQLSEKIGLKISGNVGVKAQIDNPNTVFYGNPGNGNAPIKESDIVLELYPTTYTPVELSTEFNFKLTSKANLVIQHAYQRTIFFESNTMGAGINLRIWND